MTREEQAEERRRQREEKADERKRQHEEKEEERRQQREEKADERRRQHEEKEEKRRTQERSDNMVLMAALLRASQPAPPAYPSQHYMPAFVPPFHGPAAPHQPPAGGRSSEGDAAVVVDDDAVTVVVDGAAPAAPAAGSTAMPQTSAGAAAAADGYTMPLVTFQNTSASAPYATAAPGPALGYFPGYHQGYPPAYGYQPTFGFTGMGGYPAYHPWPVAFPPAAVYHPSYQPASTDYSHGSFPQASLTSSSAGLPPAYASGAHVHAKLPAAATPGTGPGVTGAGV